MSVQEPGLDLVCDDLFVLCFQSDLHRVTSVFQRFVQPVPVVFQEAINGIETDSRSYRDFA